MEAEHLAALDEVMSKLEQEGLKARKEKCQFMVPSMTYLGHSIGAEGIHPIHKKVAAIKDAPNSTNVTELRVFLGLLT